MAHVLNVPCRDSLDAGFSRMAGRRWSADTTRKVRASRLSFKAPFVANHPTGFEPVVIYQEWPPVDPAKFRRTWELAPSASPTPTDHEYYSMKPNHLHRTSRHYSISLVHTRAGSGSLSRRNILRATVTQFRRCPRKAFPASKISFWYGYCPMLVFRAVLVFALLI